MLELNVTRCRGELRLLAGTFSQVWALQRVRLSDVERLVVRRHAFLNLSAPHTLLEVVDCGSAVVETHAFRAVRGPLTAVISRCAHVIVQNSAFSWILAITVKDVPRLELFKQAFSFETPTTVGRHGPAAMVLLQNVIMAELPQSAFPSSAAEVRLVDAEVRTVRRDAFCANTLFSVVFQNTSLHRVEAGAFSDRTLIQYLEMSGVRIRVLASHAVQAAITNLTIQHSRVSEVLEGAMNITVAKATFNNNVFEKILSRGFVLKYWNRIVMTDNTFQWLEADAMDMPFESLPGVSTYEFSFAGNEVDQFNPGALRFAVKAIEGGAGIRTRLTDNRFTQICHCNLISWVKKMVTSEKEALDEIFNTSSCTVDSVLARCFNVPQGFVNMRNYTELVCGSREVIVCEEMSKGESAVSVVRSSSADSSEVDHEKKVLGLIFIVVVCAMIIIVTITGILWLRRNGYCLQARIILLPTTTSCLTMFSTFFQGIGTRGLVTARSISRLSMHEYTELQQQQKQRQGLLVIAEDNVSEGQTEQVACEDRWTQTLPEELTQELLQSLREKLDDPENYSEARDMIEHLYDLIKVEESCNNNNMPSTSRNAEYYDDEDDDNLYDVIQAPSPPPPRLRQNRSKKITTCSVGTRAPSPDKLLSYAQVRRNRQPAVVCEYVEPRDREQHLYAELPGGGATTLPTTSSGSNKSPARPLSFLRALGESILPRVSATVGGRVQQPISVLCEYTEPTDTAVHVYTEVPPTSTIKCSSKMANRPLPTKPDQDNVTSKEKDDPGEGTSAS
ncbi:uncharacterized protein LOC110827728 isoform X2 [Zootermopsis nevadensis]|uniref:Uncharacterized protein n=1 Tax=Zootermopsis nevadensis TaxID=136037 RepID=A0A067RD95_ZOONE|nr:uncharacterized protein LOC110827728 isoform X2 [Zootermopsis nevadensis]KDR21727.1 hypothetical protein L798_02784 [Zootermopsis nevadensis]